MPKLQRHACFLFYEVDSLRSASATEFARVPVASIGTLLCDGAVEEGHDAKDGWLGSDVAASIDSNRHEERIWQECNPVVGDDLHPHVRRLLGRVGQDSGLEAHAKVFCLSDNARKLVQGRCLKFARDTPKADRIPKNLELVLKPSVERRIRYHCPAVTVPRIGVRVTDVSLVRFRTGKDFLVAEVEFFNPSDSNVHPYLVVEGMYSLARFNQVTWVCEGADLASPQPRFRFGEMIRSLIEFGRNSHRRDQLFTACYLQFDEALDVTERQRLMFRLSRNYSTDYRVPSDLSHCEQVNPFENVSHLFTLEGSATVVDRTGCGDQPLPEFLAHYLENTYRSTYMPIALLAYHESRYLLNLTDAASFWPDDSTASIAIERMQGIRSRASKFVLCFRFTYVSRISMHNEVNQALRKALGLDWMYAELERDTLQINHLLQRLAEDRRERRFRWLNILGTFGLTWLTTFTIAKELLEVKVIEHALHVCPDDVGLWATLAGLLAGLPAALYAGSRDKLDKESLAEHAIHENILHQAKH